MMETMALSTAEGTFEGYDGSELFFQTWPKENPDAIVLGIHGLGEHSGSYNLLAEGLQETSHQLIMADLRGHGRSSGKRGVGTIDEFVLDTKQFHGEVVKKFPRIPLFFLGHSTGGLILIKLLIRHGSLGALGAVLSSPLLGVTVEIPAFKRKSANFLAKVAPNMTLSNEIPDKHLTHYKKVLESYANDSWRHNRISPRLFVDMLASMDYVFKQRDKLKIPLLMQQAGDDLVVSQKRGEEFFDGLEINDKEKIIYEGYYHEIYNEIWREKPFNDLKRWIQNHIKKAYGIQRESS